MSIPLWGGQRGETGLASFVVDLLILMLVLMLFALCGSELRRKGAPCTPSSGGEKLQEKGEGWMKLVPRFFFGQGVWAPSTFQTFFSCSRCMMKPCWTLGLTVRTFVLASDSLGLSEHLFGFGWVEQRNTCFILFHPENA